MNFQTPQFIEQEAKIIGFLTLKQFLYLAAAAGLSFIFFYIFNFFLWFMFSAILAAIAVSLAFLKIGGQSFPKVLVAAFYYFWRPRVYTWQRIVKELSLETSEIEKLKELRRNMSIQEKLKNAALSITTGKAFAGKKETKQGERYQRVTYLTGEKGVAKRVDY